MPLAPSSQVKHQHPHASLGGICGLKRRRESNMLGIRGVRRGIHMTASAMARTYISVTELVSHPEMLPLNEVAPSNIFCSNTRCERRRKGGVRARACLWLPPFQQPIPFPLGKWFNICTASRDRFIQLGKDVPSYTSPRGPRVPSPRPNPTRRRRPWVVYSISSAAYRHVRDETRIPS